MAVTMISAVAGECAGCGSPRLSVLVCHECEKLASAIVAAGQSFTRLERSLAEEISSAADALAEARFWKRKVDELESTAARSKDIARSP